MELERAASKWRTSARLRGVGFNTDLARRPPARVGYLHAEHRRYSHDGRYLDPRRPESLIYANVPGRPLVLVGVVSVCRAACTGGRRGARSRGGTGTPSVPAGIDAGSHRERTGPARLERRGVPEAR